MITSATHHRGIITSLALGVIVWVFGVAGSALAQDPNNAALLYYQAGFVCPELSPLGAVIMGRDPNDQAREFLNLTICQETIELVQAGTRTARCDWGILRSRGMFPPTLACSPLQRLAMLLGAHACTLAADGQYRLALENCMDMRRFAAHIGDDSTLMWAISESTADRGMSAIQYVLGRMPPDETTLTWLKGQLNSVAGAPWRPEKALRNHAEVELQRWMVCPRERESWKEQFLEEIEDETIRQEIKKLPESELATRARASLELSLRQAVEILTKDAAYPQKQATLEQFVNQLKDKAKNGDPGACLTGAPQFAETYYRLHINAVAHFNAVMNAVEVYLAKARTAQLPKGLPDGSPPDPYSGESFQYERMETGFILRCRAKAVGYSEIRQFEFKVRSQTE